MRIFFKCQLLVFNVQNQSIDREEKINATINLDNMKVIVTRLRKYRRDRRKYRDINFLVLSIRVEKFHLTLINTTCIISSYKIYH